MNTSDLILTHVTRRHFIRVGHTPVMEATVLYPVLFLADEAGKDSPRASAVERLNQAYRAMAEAFLRWCEGVPARVATEAFAAAGHGAVYTFDRRCVSCRMEARTEAEFLVVRREASYGSRRGSVPTSRREERDIWRLSNLSPTRDREPTDGRRPRRRGAAFSRKNL